MKIVRSILAVIVGWIVSMIVISCIHIISFAIHRPDDGKSFGEQMEAVQRDKEYTKTILQAATTGGLIMVVVAWTAGAFLGGATAACIAARARVVHAAIIGATVLAGTIMNALNMRSTYDYAHPDWVLLLGLLLPLPISMWGGKLVARRFEPTGEATPEPRGA